jgi:hypothetical protein
MCDNESTHIIPTQSTIIIAQRCFVKGFKDMERSLIGGPFIGCLIVVPLRYL